MAGTAGLIRLLLLLRYSIASSIFTNMLLVLACLGISNAQEKGQYLDLGDDNGIGRFNLTEGFHPGGSIIVSGTLKSNAKGFITNLEESSSKYYLHINADIDTKELVFSHKDDNKWASKFGFNDTTTNLTSLCPGGNFDLTIISLETGYKIQMNKTLCYFFNYRFNTLNIRNIRFAGEHVTINSVLYKSGDPAAQLEACNTIPTTSHCVNQNQPFQCKCFDGSTNLTCPDSGPESDSGKESSAAVIGTITAIIFVVLLFVAVFLVVLYKRKITDKQKLQLGGLPQHQPEPGMGNRHDSENSLYGVVSEAQVTQKSGNGMGNRHDSENSLYGAVTEAQVQRRGSRHDSENSLYGSTVARDA